MLMQDGFNLKIVALEWCRVPLCAFWSLPLISVVSFSARCREAQREMSLRRAGSESHFLQDSFSLLRDFSPFLGSWCKCSPQTMLLDNEPVSLTRKPMLAVLGNLRGGGGGWERRRLGGSRAGFLGGDLSHPFHIEKHFSARGGEKRCLSVPVPSAPIGLPVFA